MKKYYPIIIVCIVSLLIIGCSNTVMPNIINDSTDVNDSDSHLDYEDEHSSKTSAEKRYDSPADLVGFSNIEDFSSYIVTAKKGGDVADLASLECYYLPTGIPEGYSLYKITAGIVDIGFWYLSNEYLLSNDATLAAESQQKHFLFISSRGSYSFESIKGQLGVSGDDLREGKYLLMDNKIIWEQNGVTFLMYFPREYEISDIQTLCETEQYIKNKDTNEYECVKN